MSLQFTHQSNGRFGVSLFVTVYRRLILLEARRATEFFRWMIGVSEP